MWCMTHSKRLNMAERLRQVPDERRVGNIQRNTLSIGDRGLSCLAPHGPSDIW